MGENQFVEHALRSKKLKKKRQLIEEAQNIEDFFKIELFLNQIRI